MRVLHDEPVAETEPMTAGLDIREWPVPGTDIKAHFWDFGGQVMAHATHQLFLRESCLYVLVISSRSEIVDQTVWQHGVLLSHPHSETHALLEVDYHLRILSIWVNGQNARDYLTLIRDEIHTILARLDIDYEALLTLAASARIGPPARRASAAETAPYQQILAFDQQKMPEYISSSGTRYDVQKILQGIVSAQTLAQERKQFIVNISNSRLGNVTLADQIDESFNQRD